jgi:anti-sigma regulatory factor (Ser/Thr protein kinase)
MTSAPGGRRSGFTHELLLHSSLEEMLAFAVPFVRDGVAAEEPTLLLVRPETAAEVLPRVEQSPHLTVLPALGWSGRPSGELQAADGLLAGYGSDVSRVRMLNEEPIVPEEHWHEWRRVEAAVNIALDRYAAWLVCSYDRRALDEEMVADLHATHRLVGRDDHHRDNVHFQDPVDFLAKHLDAEPDPAESTAPAAELINPSPGAARAAVAAFARHSRLPPVEIENLVFAAHEAVTNSLVHGRPPVVMRVWVLPGRTMVTVTDAGTGPTDPLVGLLPPLRHHGPGLGLWLCHQLVDVTHRRHPDGYTICLSATGRPQPVPDTS